MQFSTASFVLYSSNNVVVAAVVVVVVVVVVVAVVDTDGLPCSVQLQVGSDAVRKLIDGVHNFVVKKIIRMRQDRQEMHAKIVLLFHIGRITAAI